jgi:hypothetical protein
VTGDDYNLLCTVILQDLLNRRSLIFFVGRMLAKTTTTAELLDLPSFDTFTNATLNERQSHEIKMFKCNDKIDLIMVVTSGNKIIVYRLDGQAIYTSPAFSSDVLCVEWNENGNFYEAGKSD